MTKYEEFLRGKTLQHGADGIEIPPDAVSEVLFSFQRQLVIWALRKGRAALFADTGLGKTFMQIEWARLTGERTLIIAPLGVAQQTVQEGKRLGVPVVYARSQSEAVEQLTITNYEMIEHFSASEFGAVVLDESSILKSLDGKTRKRLTEMFSETRYRLCCTATPAPNDISEIANHAEFLGIMSRSDMLASFFVHADGWRLKGHAEQPFYRWLASWGMSVKKPSDIGFCDDGYDLPALNVQPLWVKSDYAPEGMMLSTGLKGITDRIGVRRATADARVQAAADLVNASSEQWVVWCGMNVESRAAAQRIQGAVEVAGSDDRESKVRAIQGFQDGSIMVLVTKPKIAGFGLNLQNAHNMVFLGLSDSWESYYQCIRREWRFGQTKPVNVSIVLSDAEEGILENVKRKEEEAQRMSANLIQHVAQFEQAEIAGVQEDWKYREADAEGEAWRLMLGDCVERLAEIPTGSVDLSVFSPPFLSLYTYSPTERDIGNSQTEEQFFEHFGYVVDNLLRVTNPGRLCAIHSADVPAMLVRDGYIGLKDFPGMLIRAMTSRGWIYHSRITIDKNPQPQALRTKAKGLMFGQMEKDAAWSRPGLADYLLVFRKPGENAVPIIPDITRQQWILWARPVWYGADYNPGSFVDGAGDSTSKSGFGSADGIRETDTLNVREATGDKDERHIAPLQLGTIERCIRLWSNPGETILSPFAGIGSEGYQAVKFGRRYVGIELNQRYFEVAAKNLRQAEMQSKTPDLFSYAAANP